MVEFVGLNVNSNESQPDNILGCDSFLGLRGDCPWIKQPLFLIYRFAVSFPQKTFAAIVWPVDYQG